MTHTVVQQGLQGLGRWGPAPGSMDSVVLTPAMQTYLTPKAPQASTPAATLAGRVVQHQAAAFELSTPAQTPAAVAAELRAVGTLMQLLGVGPAHWRLNISAPCAACLGPSGRQLPQCWSPVSVVSAPTAVSVLVLP
jgi:hypothetical protein